jgi:DNA mismatch repair protein MutL
MPRSDQQSGPRWIRPLPERLVNKIAAGEVVERPASVVKELVENALDAGATQVDITIEKSGMKSIRIVDNGCGIDPDQIEVAFGRHATSKISEFKDLDAVTSYGFRGEALPSIASVSRLRMVSRPAGSDHGMEVVYEGGVLQSKEPVAAPPGTTVEVSDLFYNVPARRKFLKAETTEARHISRVVTAIAIGRHDVSFSYKLNDRSVFALPPDQSVTERVTALLRPGREFMELETEHGSIRIVGALGTPDLAARNRYSQYLFINGRFVQAPSLAHAILAGYGELMPRGNYPVGAVLLHVEPTDVDVNVHPAKTEVRLSRERDVYEALYRTVKSTLQGDSTIPHFRLRGRPADQPGTQSGQQREPHRIDGIASPSRPHPNMLADLYKIGPDSAPSTPPEVVKVDTRTGEIVEEPVGGRSPEKRSEHFGPADGLRLIGRFADLYLILQAGEDLFIVDQHTAHERVLFEETYRSLEKHALTGQQLLLPVEVDLTPDQFAVFEETRDLLNESGFQVDEFGGRMIRLEAVPAVLSRKAPERIIRNILDDLLELRKSGYELKKAMAETIACRAAIKAGDRISDQEAEGLLKSLLQCENKYSCPHGRPTFIRLSRADLDRQFGRA